MWQELCTQVSLAVLLRLKAVSRPRGQVCTVLILGPEVVSFVSGTGKTSPGWGLGAVFMLCSEGNRTGCWSTGSTRLGPLLTCVLPLLAFSAQLC